MVNCCAFGCKSRSTKKEPGITFHRFPRDLRRQTLWVKNLQIADWEPTNNDKVCSKHFELNLFYRIGDRTRLLDEAVPTIFQELPKYLQKKPQSKRSTKRVREDNDQPSTSALPASSAIDQNLEDSPRKKKLRRQLFQEQKRRKIQSTKVRVLGQKVKRYKKKILSLKQIIKELTNKNLLLLEHSNVISNIQGISRELLKRKFGKKCKYSPELRKFAITLSFFSPKGYDYVRKEFDSCLPHRSTIGKWFKNVNAEPGFTKESFDILKMHVENSEKPIFLSLIIDEICIRKHIEWDGKKFSGYVNYGVDLQDDGNAIAKEAFVLLVNCINGRWKLPVGYFFTDGLNGHQKSSIVAQCVKLLQATGATVASLTFDGAPSNIAMANTLGFNLDKLDIQNIETHIKLGEKNIYIFWDHCHMLKLVRNTFGERKVLVDKDGGFIKWEFIENLESLQNLEGLHLGNKLRVAHVKFFKQKMKVRLAVQLLSNSVADALAFCEEDLGLTEFRECEATCNFIRMMNNVFDVLNSRSLVPPGYKKALCMKNLTLTKNFITTAIAYIAKLKFSDGELVINSRRKTGFLGLIISLKSSLALYNDLIVKQQDLLYLPLYKVSQDHLELFFSSIRARGGWNNNPTSRQFTAAYKRLLVRAEIRDGGMGNCIALEDIPILSGPSRFNNLDSNINAINSSRLDFTEHNETYDLQRIWSEHEYIMNTNVISNCSLQIVVYIAGFVALQLSKTIKCEDCLGVLSGNKENFLRSLISKKNRGGLTYPSKDIIEICKVCEHFLRINKDSLTKKNSVIILKNKIMFNCIQNNYFNELKDHILNCNSNHIYFLTESVISKYLNIRIHFMTKKRSEVIEPVRNYLTKTIIFKGQ